MTQALSQQRISGKAGRPGDGLHRAPHIAGFQHNRGGQSALKHVLAYDVTKFCFQGLRQVPNYASSLRQVP